MSRWRPERRLVSLDALAAEGAGAPAGPARADWAAFEGALSTIKPGRGTRLTCVLASRLVRYLVVPWNARAQSPAARRVFAEHCFRETYGELAREWTVRVDPPRYQQASLACAVDSALLGRVAAAASAAGLMLDDAQPALMQAFNAQCERLLAATYWFVVSEPPALTIFLVSDGAPVLVKVVAAPLSNLPQVLARERFALGFDAAGCPTHVAGSSSASAGADTARPASALAPSASALQEAA